MVSTRFKELHKNEKQEIIDKKHENLITMISTRFKDLHRQETLEKKLEIKSIAENFTKPDLIRDPLQFSQCELDFFYDLFKQNDLKASKGLP